MAARAIEEKRKIEMELTDEDIAYLHSVLKSGMSQWWLSQLVAKRSKDKQMNNETIAELEALEKKYFDLLGEDNAGAGDWWSSYLKNAPSRIERLDIACAYYWQAMESKTGKETHNQFEEEQAKIRPLLNKEDWDYAKWYCTDGRYRKWVAEMREKAPDEHPFAWCD